MNLEDHLGDILCKARAMSGVSAQAVARGAGLSEPELASLEETGRISRSVDFAGVAAATGLDAAKLEGIARGWLPESKDLGLWRELRQVSTTENGNRVHCYLVWDEVTREAALFDTGWDAEPVIRIVAEEQLHLKYLFLTHSHHDHIAGLEQVRGQYPKIQLHTDASDALPQHRNRRNDCIHLGSLRITNRDTPGHAPDGVTYLVGNWPDDAPHVAIVGDAIFAGSMGRGFDSWDVARRKVREQILTLPPQTLLCPGHGPLTSAAEEKEHNPFF